jgi:RimJ/RimL family protein N-acetyltransferase/acyl carrier protein
MLTKIELINKFSNTLPKIKTELGIYFEHLSMGGLEEMHKYSKDERLYEFFEFEPFKEIDDTKAYIEKLLQRMSGQSGEKNAMYWFIRRKSDDRLVGTATLLNLNYARQSIEWGYGVDPELWGNGYVLQMQEILKYFVFEVLELNRLHGITMVTNERTIQSILTSSMKHEGVLRDFYCKNGIYYDGWQYGMIAKDYHKSNVVSSSVLVNMDDIISVISSVLTEEEITDESSIENTFSWDSLNHMAIIIALKEELSIEFKPGEVYIATSVKKILKKVSG